MYPGQQPHPDRPARAYPAQARFAAPADGPVEVAFVSDQTTARTLSRVTALMNWRLPGLWMFVAALPVVLLVGGIARSLASGTDTEVDLVEVFGAFFVVLAFELVVLVLLTGWTMVRGNPHIRRYSQSGTQMRARYTHDALHLRLPHSVDTHLPYTHIKRLSLHRDTVYLRKSDGKGFALPRALVSEPALALMRNAGVRM
jgi:hypothetical protein